MTTLSDQDFRVKSDEALESARRALLPMADQDGFEVVSPNAPVKQIWVSAMARGYRLPWSAETGTFALNGETLTALLQRLTREFLST